MFLIRNDKDLAYFQNAERKSLPVQNSVSTKISFRNDRKTKTFSDEGKLRDLLWKRPTLEALLKEVL